MSLKLIPLNTLRRKLNSYNILRTAGWSSYEIWFWSIIGKINKKWKLNALRKLGFKVANLKYGLKFTPDSNIQEVIFDKIYTLYPEFIPKKNDIVMDIGSHHGDYAILCSKYYGSKAYAFEPMPPNFDILKRNMNLNKVNDKVKFYKTAIGDKNHKIKLFYERDQIMNIHSKNSVEVNMRTLDSFHLKPTLLKIDVEGFEMIVLKGAIKTIKKYRPKIIIETHTSKLKGEVTKLLIGLNYSLIYSGRAVYNVDKNMDLVQNLFFISNSSSRV